MSHFVTVLYVLKILCFLTYNIIYDIIILKGATDDGSPEKMGF